MRIGIVGQGYVGTAVGVAAHEAGHFVIGIEADRDKVVTLQDCLEYKVSEDYQLLRDVDAVIIAVPTPLDEYRRPNLGFINDACSSLREVLINPVLVVNESTSFPGTLRSVIAPIIGGAHFYASAPERIDPANSNWGIKNTPRIIAGLTQQATRKAVELYRSFCDEIIEVSSPEIAEAAKLFENSFRQVNIALVNEFAQIANSLGISTFDTLRAASSKPYGFMTFMPSIGVGGHCIPVDPIYLSYSAEKVGVEASFINLANRVNAGMPHYIARKISELLGGSVSGKKIQICGISYKADVADTRESPALVLIQELREMGAHVSWHDEVVGTYSGESSKPLEEVDLGVIATAHSGVDYGLWRISDTRVVDVSTSTDTGWKKLL